MINYQDEFEIQNLVNRYSDAVTQRDWKTYQDCWTEDAVWDLGEPVNQKKTGISDIMTEVKRAVGGMSLFVQMPHYITVLSVDGDTATGRATLNEIGKIKPENKGLLGDADGMNIVAVYDDSFRKDAKGRWKFSMRKYQILLFDGHAPHGKVITDKSV